ncbi:MAG: antitoxin AF2212-like protein [Armatimonadia bacterium]
MSANRKVIRARYDGRCFVPVGPVDLAPDTEVEVMAVEEEQTWLERHFGIRLASLRGRGPLLTEMVIEDRGEI